MFGLHPHGAHCLGTQAFHLAPSNPLYLLFPRVLEKVRPFRERSRSAPPARARSRIDWT